MLGVILDILLIVLKVIGIFVLSILGLFILLLLVVLFVPVRYKSNGQFEKTEDGFEHEVYAKITWCLHIISIKFNRVQNKNVISFKILGIDFLNRKKKTKKKKARKRTNRKTSQGEIITTDSPKTIVEKTENINTIKQEDYANKNAEGNVKKEQINQNENAKEKKTKPKLIQRIKAFICKLGSICEKVKNLNNVKNSFIEYLKKDTSRNAIKEIKKIILKLLKHILPRKLRATVGFGFEDPATTGKVLGATSIFYGIYGDKLELEPDFNKPVLYGKYKFKGRIRMCSLLIVALKLYRNKWIKEFINFSKESVKDL